MAHGLRGYHLDLSLLPIPLAAQVEQSPRHDAVSKSYWSTPEESGSEFSGYTNSFAGGVAGPCNTNQDMSSQNRSCSAPDTRYYTIIAGARASVATMI